MLQYVYLFFGLSFLHFGKFQKQSSRGGLLKGVLINFTKFTGKHQRQRPATLLKKETLAQVFSYEFCEISTSQIFIKLD